MPEVEVLSTADAISVVKPNRTAVDYFIFDEYEIHKCVIPAQSTQEWHMHQIIEETLIVISGEITVCWKENSAERHQTAGKDSVVRVRRSMHTIKNQTDNDAVFWVVRTVPTGSDKRKIIRDDKILMDADQIP